MKGSNLTAGDRFDAAMQRLIDAKAEVAAAQKELDDASVALRIAKAGSACNRQYGKQT